MPQQVEVGTKATDDSMADPEAAKEAEEDVIVEEEAEEDTRAELQHDEPPRVIHCQICPPWMKEMILTPSTSPGLTLLGT